MDTKILKGNVQMAIDAFDKEKEHLYKIDIYEPTFSHRIAVHLENIFQDSSYIIDCEYNKDIDNPKKDDSGNKIRPDIIIHKRNSTSDNLIILEVKKGSIKSMKAKKDIEKLSRVTNLNYLLKGLITITKNKTNITWI